MAGKVVTAASVAAAAAAASIAASAATHCAVAAASAAPTHRQCEIEIENKSDYVLCNPRVYTHSGYCDKPLPATIGPSESGGTLFTKTPYTARGSVGVFTYDLQNKSTKQCSGKVAVMFSNPYDLNLYSNWFAVGVFNMDIKCDRDLYKKMYYKAEKGFVRGEAKSHTLTYTSGVVNITATMSDSYQPVIKVQLCKK